MDSNPYGFPFRGLADYRIYKVKRQRIGDMARLMGFPDTFRIPVSDTQAYRQFGNAVVVPVVRAVASAIKPHILEILARSSEKQGSKAGRVANG